MTSVQDESEWEMYIEWRENNIMTDEEREELARRRREGREELARRRRKEKRRKEERKQREREHADDPETRKE